MKKVVYGIVTVLICMIVFLVNAVTAIHLIDRVMYRSFYAKAEAVFATPDINGGFVPQGFDYVEENKTFLVTGYMSDNKPSRVYVIGADGKTTCTELKKSDGGDYLGHTGGIARFGEFVYVTGADGLDVFSYTDIASGAASTKKLGSVTTYNDPAYCYIYNGYVLTGSFYRAGNYETPAHERITTPNGDKNTSLVTVFKLDETKDFGIDPTPKAVISTGDQVQGMCITDKGKIVLSTSYGLKTSKLLVYDGTKLSAEQNHRFAGTANGEAFAFEGLTRYYLDSASFVETIDAPPMSEELVYLDGKIYIMNESACNKYIVGKFTSGRNIYAYSYAE